MQGHMKQDGGCGGGVQRWHFELFGIVNNMWNFQHGINKYTDN